MKMGSEWIDAGLLRHFEAEGTDAHRLCTIDGGWVERFGRDVLISYRTDAARDRLVRELEEWRASVETTFDRVFERFLPKRNEERSAPRLVSGNADKAPETIATEHG